MMTREEKDRTIKRAGQLAGEYVPILWGCAQSCFSAIVDALRERVGLEGNTIPRKAEPAYGRVVAEMLRQARRLDLPGQEIERLAYIGDTPMNDGTAFRNICAAGGWPGWAFIGRDTLGKPPEVKIEGALYVSNRWSALSGFLRFLEEKQFALDEHTEVSVA